MNRLIDYVPALPCKFRATLAGVHCPDEDICWL